MLRTCLSRVCTAVFILALVLLIVTASIGLPIYFRPFYYAQISLWDLPGQTGQSAEDIRRSYDEVLDYLTLPNEPFSTGVFEYSEEGKSHFEDCKVLFDLNAWVLVFSALAVAVLALMNKKKVISFSRPWGLRPSAVAGGALLVLFSLLAVLLVIDFDTAFWVFHAVMFPGKDNWLFDPVTDGIINALPIEFFASCAALIGLAAVSASLGLLLAGLRDKKRRRVNMNIIEKIELLKEKYGSDRLIRENGTILLAPQEMPKCDHMLFKPLCEKTIDECIRKQYKNKFPDQYADFLKYSNGANLCYTKMTKPKYSHALCLFSIYGLPMETSVAKRLNCEEPYDMRIEDLSRNEKTPSTWLKCGSYRKTSNIGIEYDIFIDTTTGMVYGYETKSGVVIDTWDTLDQCFCDILASLSDMQREYFA